LREDFITLQPSYFHHSLQLLPDQLEVRKLKMHTGKTNGSEGIRKIKRRTKIWQKCRRQDGVL
jgi:hypothetical protein